MQSINGRTGVVNLTAPDVGVNPASTSAAGIAQLATGAEATAGTIPNKAVTPAALAQALASAPMSTAQQDAIKDQIADSASPVRSTLDGIYEQGIGPTLYVNPAGNDSHHGRTKSYAKATLAGALAAMGPSVGTIHLSPGIHEVGNGLSLSGYKCSIIGEGAGYGSSAPEKTVIKASSQSGAVLDFRGFDWPNQFLGRVRFEGFHVQGSGVADSTKSNAGIWIAGDVQSDAAESYVFSDISISDTGGPALRLGYAYLGDFERITLCTPVGAKANDVPYLDARGANGNRFYGLGFRAFTGGNDTGPGGALRLVDSGYVPHDNLFLATWFEGLHIPTNGTLINIQGNTNVISDTQFFDCPKESGATGTSHIRFVASTVQDFGGNIVRGVIPGKGTGATDPDCGISMGQSRNVVQGSKGYRGTNVILNAGVTNTTIELGGANSAAIDPAVVDNSGSATNVYRDGYLRTGRVGSWSWNESAGAAGNGPRIMDAATPANGALLIGNTGTRIQATGTTAYLSADNLQLRNIANTGTARMQLGAGGPFVLAGTGTPEGAVAAGVGSIYLRSDGGVGTSFYVKETGTSYTGWAAK